MEGSQNPRRPAASMRTTRKRCQLQGAKRSLRERHKPQPEGARVRHQGQPKDLSWCHGGRHVTKTSYREERWRELRTTEDSRPRAKDHQETTPEQPGAKRSHRQRLEAHPEGESASSTNENRRIVQKRKPTNTLTHMVTQTPRAVTTRRNSPKRER